MVETEYKENVPISPFDTPFSSFHGFSHYLQVTKLQYVNSSTTIQLKDKKWQSINKPIATGIPTSETKSLRNYAPT